MGRVDDWFFQSQLDVEWQAYTKTLIRENINFKFKESYPTIRIISKIYRELIEE